MRRIDYFAHDGGGGGARLQRHGTGPAGQARPLRNLPPPRTSPQARSSSSSSPAQRGQDIADIHRQNGGQVKEVIGGIDVQVVGVPRGQEKTSVARYQHNPERPLRRAQRRL